MAAVKQDRSKGKVNEKITKNQPQVCWPRECAESALISFPPSQTGFSGFSGPQSETGPTVHTHLYDPTVLKQIKLAAQTSGVRHSLTSAEVKKRKDL